MAQSLHNMYRTIYLTALLSSMAISASAQKIKYKELFPLLNDKKYEEAAPTLAQYLSDPKNSEDANANLQMGLMLEYHFLRYDIISDSSRLYTSGDSAVAFLEKAKGLINEKELKKRDEYYQDFFRRDLRTGEFGIKVSDVHLDIEKKLTAINDRVALVKDLHQSAKGVRKNDAAARDVYRSIVADFENRHQMLLQVSEAQMEQLENLEQVGAASKGQADALEKLGKKLSAGGYYQEVELRSIEQYGVDGQEELASEAGQVALWDYEEWARNAQSEITGAVALFKSMMVKHLQSLAQQEAQLNEGVDVEIPPFSNELISQFQQYDPSSRTQKLLEAMGMHMQLRKLLDTAVNVTLKDSSQVGAQLRIYTEGADLSSTLSKHMASLREADWSVEKQSYPAFFEAMAATYGLPAEYVQNTMSSVDSKKEIAETAVAFWQERDQWGVVEDRKVALYTQTESEPESDILTLRVLLDSEQEKVVYGIDLQSERGFVSSFGVDRTLQWTHDFELPGMEYATFQQDTLPTVVGNNSFYIFAPSKEEENLAVVSVAKDGVLKWKNLITVSKKPLSFQFDDLTQELTIFMYPEDQLPLDDSVADLGYVVIDRTGNAR